MRANIIYLIFVLNVFMSCEKTPARDEVSLPAAQEGGIFILNEGSFNNGNASLTFYDFKANTLTDDVFYTANGRHLGDVLQSMTIYNRDAFLVVNNSKKIEIIDGVSFKSKGTITGFSSPRYLLMVSGSKAYVSDLYDNHIAVVDMSTKSITKKIQCIGATEQMLMINNKVYVCNTLQKSLYIVDATTDVLTDSIQLSYGPNSLVVDKNYKLWVLCSGDKSNGINSGLFRINPFTDSVELAFKNIYPAGIFGASKLSINSAKDQLFWLNGDVQSIKITDTVIPSLPFIHSFNNVFYGIGIDPRTGEIYVSDAIDFVQKSTIYKYSASGETKGFFKGGIITSGFYFDYR